MIKSIYKYDVLGIISSNLCLLHCIATPFLFAIQGHLIAQHHNVSFWWKMLDFFFLIVSAIAIFQTSYKTPKAFISILLWLSWAFLSFIILNEKMHWFSLPEALIYIPSISLVLLHFYNIKYCKSEENCR